MKQSLFICSFLLLGSFLFAGNKRSISDSLQWKKLSGSGYVIYYTAADDGQINNIDHYLRSGIDHIEKFFHHSLQDTFNVYVFSDRSSLDKQWQKDWGDPAFKSECWMIASGVAHRLDMLSPAAWAKEACDHNPNDSTEVRQVIWHELVHVFHGQNNPDHTFNYIEKLDWLVEGTATSVSGQLDEKRLQRVKQMIADNKIPVSLDDFWKGQDKYGLAGSMVAYIEKIYGREKLFALLKFTNKNDALISLGISEEQLIKNWKDSLSR